VSLTLSNTEPVHSLLPDVARQVKFENINELQSDDLDDESDIAVLDHESSLTEQQLVRLREREKKQYKAKKNRATKKI